MTIPFRAVHLNLKTNKVKNTSTYSLIKKLRTKSKNYFLLMLLVLTNFLAYTKDIATESSAIWTKNANIKSIVEGEKIDKNNSDKPAMLKANPKNTPVSKLVPIPFLPKLSINAQEQDIIKGGTFIGNPLPANWTITGATPSFSTPGVTLSAANSSTILSQSNLSNLNFGPGSHGSAQMHISIAWSNGLPANASTASTLKIIIAGIEYATVNTAGVLPENEDASVTYSAGATGNLTIIKASANLNQPVNNTTELILDLPVDVPANGNLDIAFQTSGNASDSFFYNNVQLINYNRGFSTIYYEGGLGTVVANSNTTIFDSNFSGGMKSAKVKITNPQLADGLKVSGSSSLSGTVNGISYAITNSGTVVEFSGLAPKTDYEAAIKAVTFYVNSQVVVQNPDRTISIEVEDNLSQLSNLESSSIKVLSINTAPSFTKGADVYVFNNYDIQTITNWASSIVAGPSDESSQVLTFFVESNDNSSLFTVQPSIAANGTLVFMPKPGMVGIANLSIYLKDNGGILNGGKDESLRQSFKIIVQAVPVILTPANNTYTKNNKPTITGVTKPGAKVTVYVDGAPIGPVTADASGNWSITLSIALKDGVHNILATALAGGVTAGTLITQIIVDTVAPNAPIIITPVNNSITNNNLPVITGKAEAGSTVTVYIDGIAVGTALTDSFGNWSFTPTTALADGVHNVRATATDLAGNISVSSAITKFTIDTVAPNAPIIINPVNNSVTNNNQPAITGKAEPGSTVTVYIDGVAVGTVIADVSGNWSYTPTAALADGIYNITATATDLAGNVSVPSAITKLTIDTLAPDAPVIVKPINNSLTNNNLPVITGTAEPGSTVTVYIDGVAVGTAITDASGNWTYTTTTALTDGAHNITATATDLAGNVSVPSAVTKITVDTAAPNAPLIISPANNSTTNNNKPIITGTAEPGSTVTVYIDGVAVGTAAADASGNWTYTTTTALTDGGHNITATATDTAGNISVPSAITKITVDTVAPAAPIIVNPVNNSVTNNNKPVITGTAEPGSTVTIYIDGVAVGTVIANGTGNWTYTTTTALTDGAHNITATATDAAGNVSVPSAITKITVDTAVPNAPIIVSPANNSVTKNNKPAITGTAEPGATVTVYIDGVAVGTAIADGAGNWSYTPTVALTDGVHNITATAKDVAGNVSVPSATTKITIDTVAPAAPTGPFTADGKTSTQDRKPPMIGTAEPGSTIKLYDENNRLIGTGITGADGKWYIVPTVNLEPGPHAITATATDLAGNTSGTGTVLNLIILKSDDFSANNILTPNGDGKNDYLAIKNLENYPNNNIKIFDRAGRLLYSVKGYKNDWDGTYNGAPLAEDTYYYIVDYGDGSTVHKAFITIVRRK